MEREPLAKKRKSHDIIFKLKAIETAEKTPKEVAAHECNVAVPQHCNDNALQRSHILLLQATLLQLQDVMSSDHTFLFILHRHLLFALVLCMGDVSISRMIILHSC